MADKIDAGGHYGPLMVTLPREMQSWQFELIKALAEETYGKTPRAMEAVGCFLVFYDAIMQDQITNYGLRNPA